MSPEDELDERTRRRTLEDLEGEVWGPPAFPSRVAAESHRLRRVPLGDLTVEGLRLLIGQGIGLPYLLPLAVERLRADPLAEGDHYPGDLLKAVLGVPPDAWSGAPALRALRAAVAEILAALENAGPLPAPLRGPAAAFSRSAGQSRGRFEDRSGGQSGE